MKNDNIIIIGTDWNNLQIWGAKFFVEEKRKRKIFFRKHFSKDVILFSFFEMNDKKLGPEHVEKKKKKIVYGFGNRWEFI